jgi:hypothetical protein
LPSPIRDGSWRCAMPTAPPQLPSLHPPPGQSNRQERTHRWIKLGGNVTLELRHTQHSCPAMNKLKRDGYFAYPR